MKAVWHGDHAFTVLAVAIVTTFIQGPQRVGYLGTPTSPKILFDERVRR